MSWVSDWQRLLASSLKEDLILFIECWEPLLGGFAQQEKSLNHCWPTRQLKKLLSPGNCFLFNVQGYYLHIIAFKITQITLLDTIFNSVFTLAKQEIARYATAIGRHFGPDWPACHDCQLAKVWDYFVLAARVVQILENSAEIACLMRSGVLRSRSRFLPSFRGEMFDLILFTHRHKSNRLKQEKMAKKEICHRSPGLTKNKKSWLSLITSSFNSSGR